MEHASATVGPLAAARTQTERMLLVVLVSVPLLLAWWIHFEIGGQRPTLLVDNAIELLAPLVAAAACLRAANRVTDGRHGWEFLAAACLAWAFGQAIWTYHEVVLRADVPSPGLADAGFLLFIPFAVGGLLVLSAPIVRSAGLGRTFLDGAGIAASLLILGWGFIFRPLADEGAGHWDSFWIDAAYPVGDVILATVAVTVWLRAPAAARKTFSLLAAGLLALAVADAMYWILTFRGTYGAGNFGNALWPAGFLAIALGAWESPVLLRRAEPLQELPTGAQAMFPLLLVLPTLAVVAASTFAAVQTVDRLLVGMTMAWFLVVTARQSLLLAENTGLARRLSMSLRSTEKTAETFAQSRRELAEAQEVVGMGTWTWDMETDRWDWSEGLYAVLGLPPHHVQPSRLWFLEVVDERDRQAVHEALKASSQRMANLSIRYRLEGVEGTRWVEAKAIAEPDPRTGAPRMIGTVRDITVEMAAQKEVDEREAWLRAVTEHAWDVIGVYDREGRRMFAAGGMGRFGYAKGELLGASVFDMVHPEDVPRTKAAFEECLSRPGAPVRVEVRARHKDGRHTPVEVVAVNRLDDPMVRGIITNTRDIAARTA